MADKRHQHSHCAFDDLVDSWQDVFLQSKDSIEHIINLIHRLKGFSDIKYYWDTVSQYILRLLFRCKKCKESLSYYCGQTVSL